MTPFDRSAYGAWRQTLDNARASASVERFTLPPRPQLTVVDGLERAARIAQRQFDPFTELQPPQIQILDPSAELQPLQTQNLGSRKSFGQVWEAIKTVVSVGWTVAKGVYNVYEKAELIYNFGKGAYEFHQFLNQKVESAVSAKRPPVVYSTETSMNYYLQSDGTYIPGTIKML